MRHLRRFAICLLLCAVPASAAVLTTRRAVLATAQNTTGGSANQWQPAAHNQSVWVCGVETGTTTWSVEMSPDGGTSWTTVYDGATPMTFTDVSVCVGLPAPPNALLRTNATVCTTCTLTATVLAGPES